MVVRFVFCGWSGSNVDLFLSYVNLCTSRNAGDVTFVLWKIKIGEKNTLCNTPAATTFIFLSWAVFACGRMPWMSSHEAEAGMSQKVLCPEKCGYSCRFVNVRDIFQSRWQLALHFEANIMHTVNVVRCNLQHRVFGVRMLQITEYNWPTDWVQIPEVKAAVWWVYIQLYEAKWLLVKHLKDRMLHIHLCFVHTGLHVDHLMHP